MSADTMRSVLPGKRLMASILGRGFWGLMGVSHMPALVSAWESCFAQGAGLAGLGGFLTLSLSVLFFLLKAFDVRFLRFRPGKGATVAICLAVALIHVGCVEPSVRDTLVAECSEVLATATLIGGLTRMFGSIRGALARRRYVGCVLVPSRRPGNSIEHDGLLLCCWVLVYRSFSLRAPPVPTV